MSFVKVHEGILRSSLCDADVATRWCWITLLVLADRYGTVRSTPSGLARAGNLPLEDVQRALEILMAPDPESATPDEEGRRLLPVPGGWRVVTYQAYRDRRDADETREAAAERQRRHRQTDASQSVTPCHTSSRVTDVTSCDASQPVTALTAVTESNANAEAEAEAEAEEDMSTPAGADLPPQPLLGPQEGPDEPPPSGRKEKTPRKAALSDGARRLWVWWCRALAKWSPEVALDRTPAGEPKTGRDAVLLNKVCQRYTHPVLTFSLSRALEGKRASYWRGRLVSVGMLSATVDQVVGEFASDLKVLESSRRWNPDERLDAARV